MTHSYFRPAPWLPGPHAQTLGARLVRSRLEDVDFERERLTLPDNDFLDLDWTRRTLGKAVDEDGPLVLVVHGLEGSSRSGYAKELYRALGGRGVATVGMNFRSCSGELNLMPRLYHSGETDDISFVIGELRARYQGRPLGAVGVSLGGNVLLKYLGERGDRARSAQQITAASGKGERECQVDGGNPLSCAAAISVPFDLSAGADFMERGFSKVYRRSLVGRLKKKVRAKAALLHEHIDVEGTLASRTFREFDDLSTAPLHGFKGAADYYQRSSSAGFLQSIRTHTLLIHSTDDPFLPPDAVPHGISDSNEYVQTLFTDRGGHVGFVEGPPWAPRFWAEQTAAQFLSEHL